MLKNLTADYDYLAHPGLMTNEQVQVRYACVLWVEGMMKLGSWWAVGTGRKMLKVADSGTSRF